jgi:hypothetical protein
MRVSKKVRRMVAVAAAGILSASVASPLSGTSDVNCSSFPGGVVPPGDHNYNIIVDVNCTVGSGANVNGNLIEPAATPHSVTVGSGARERKINGNIVERGEGFIRVFLGGQAASGGEPESDDVFNGALSEEGGGEILITVMDGGSFNGPVKEDGSGNVEVFLQDVNALNHAPALFNGSIEEKGDGLVEVAFLSVLPPPVGGIYNGSIREEDAGDLQVFISDGSSLVNGSVEESGAGEVDVFIDPTSNYHGNTVEKGIGNVFLEIAPGADYNGNVVERDLGICTVIAPPGQPRGNVDCDTP